MTRYHAVIPTIGRSPLLLDLLQTLLDDGDCVFIDLPDNGDESTHGLDRLLDDDRAVWPDILTGVEQGRILKRKTSGTIYRAWNEAMDASRYTPLAILNDDIVLHPGSVAEAMSWLTDACPIVGLNYRRTVAEGVAHLTPRPAPGTYRTGNIGGFAFVVKPDRCGRVDPRFQWWYGDDDLIYRTTVQLGRQAMIAEGAPVEHPAPSTSGNQMDWLGEAIADDEDLFRQLWPNVVAGG